MQRAKDWPRACPEDAAGRGIIRPRVFGRARPASPGPTDISGWPKATRAPGPRTATAARRYLTTRHGRSSPDICRDRAKRAPCRVAARPRISGPHLRRPHPPVAARTAEKFGMAARIRPPTVLRHQRPVTPSTVDNRCAIITTVLSGNSASRPRCTDSSLSLARIARGASWITIGASFGSGLIETRCRSPSSSRPPVSPGAASRPPPNGWCRRRCAARLRSRRNGPFGYWPQQCRCKDRLSGATPRSGRPDGTRRRSPPPAGRTGTSEAWPA